MRHQNPKGIVAGRQPRARNPALTTGGCSSFDPLKYDPGWARGEGVGGGWGEGAKWLLRDSVFGWVLYNRRWCQDMPD